MVTFQLTIDCANPGRQAAFWAFALGYQPQDPPAGFDNWDAFYRTIGVPEDELGGGPDRIEDLAGAGPRIWFQLVPESKTIKNRLHLDIFASAGRSVPLEARKEQVDAAVRRLVAAGATRSRVLAEDGVDHYAVTMLDPEGNEFCVV